MILRRIQTLRSRRKIWISTELQRRSWKREDPTPFMSVLTIFLMTSTRSICLLVMVQAMCRTLRSVSPIYVDLCETCLLKKNKVRKSLVVKPIVWNILHSRCPFDLIDMQSDPDGDKKFILNYQDHLSKFIGLRPLTSKRTEEGGIPRFGHFLFPRGTSRTSIW